MVVVVVADADGAGVVAAAAHDVAADDDDDWVVRSDPRSSTSARWQIFAAAFPAAEIGGPSGPRWYHLEAAPVVI